MSTEEIISSGLIEAYALNLTDKEETIWVEKALAESEEARKTLSEFEVSLENSYMNMQSHIQTNKEVPVKKGLLTSMRPSFKYAMAAGLILLVSSTIGNFILFNQSRKAKQDLTALQQSSGGNNSLFVDLANVFSDEDVRQIALKGQNSHSVCHCTMYWNAEKGEVVICVHHLSSPGQDRQYQLWGFIDGKAVNLGTFDLNKEKKIHHKLKQNEKNISGFVVTLEKKGGSDQPTMENIFLKGTVI